MAETTFFDFPITKTEKQEDGTIFVFGPVTDDSVDSDRQIVDPEFASRGLSKWFASGANLREMHQPKAIGLGVELVREGNAHLLKGHIINKDAAELAEKRVLRAWSVGISNAKIDRTKNPQARGGTIVDGDFVEVSLVDRPANVNCKVDLVTKAANGDAHFTDIVVKADMDDECPTCKGSGKIKDGHMDCPDCDGSGKMKEADETKALFAVEGAVYKKDYSAEQRREMAKNGHALSDGSYPIGDTEDLHNAYILAASGHGDVAAAKSLIGRRAKELGAPNPFDKGDEKTEKGTIPPADQAVTAALDEADDDIDDAQEAQEEDNEHHMSEDDDGDDDAMKSEAPYQVKRLHDFLCAAYTSDAVKSAYPTVARFGDVVDPRYWAGQVTEIIDLDHGTGTHAGDIAKASEMYGLSIQLTKADESAIDEAHEVLSKAFADSYPSVHLTPGDIMPSQFKRPYITGGRANESAKPGQKPRMPMATNVPNADQFDRHYLTDGRSANSPEAGPPNSPMNMKRRDCVQETAEVQGMTICKVAHTPTGLSAQGVDAEDAWKKLKDVAKDRQFYTNNARDQMLQTMTQMHDLVAAAHPGCCPMSMKASDQLEIEPASDDGGKIPNEEDAMPKAIPGYTKSDETLELVLKGAGVVNTAAIQKYITTEIAKVVEPYEKKIKKLKKNLTAEKDRIAELEKMADPEQGAFRGGRGVIPFLPKVVETEQGPEDQAEVEKLAKVERLVEVAKTSPDQATKRQALERLEELLTPDELAATLVKTG